MILLPIARDSYLKSFALSLGLVITIVGLSLMFSTGLSWLILIIGLALALSISGLVRPRIIAPLYSTWNMAARYFARAARFFTLTVCFYIIFFAVGRAGSSLKLMRPTLEGSLWSSKTSLSPVSLPYEFSHSVEGLGSLGWLRSYFFWAKSSGQLWTLCLIPFVAMLAALEIYTDRRFPAGVYTLF